MHAEQRGAAIKHRIATTSATALSRILCKNQGPGTRDQGPGTRDQGPGTRDQVRLLRIVPPVKDYYRSLVPVPRSLMLHPQQFDDPRQLRGVGVADLDLSFPAVFRDRHPGAEVTFQPLLEVGQLGGQRSGP